MELTDEEKDFLMELLQTAHSEVLHQLHHAETQNYKRILKKKAGLIEDLQQRLRMVTGDLATQSPEAGRPV